jgi:hypothetical protein
MNTNNAVSQPQIGGRSRPFRSLLVAVAGALILTAAFIPRASAFVVVYFNFEDTFTTPPGFDNTSDQTPAFGGDNPGGGTQSSTLSLSGTTDFANTTGLLTNRTAGDSDTANPGQALTLFHAKNNPSPELCFNANTTGLTDIALSFAIDNSGNGYNNVDLTINGTSATGGAGLAITTGTSQTLTFDSTNSTIDSVAKGPVTYCLVFTGGQSNGVNRQTTIDNIQLTAIPEPSTVMGGLLGACGLCWHQRRRLIRFLRLLPT